MTPNGRSNKAAYEHPGFMTLSACLVMLVGGAWLLRRYKVVKLMYESQPL